MARKITRIYRLEAGYAHKELPEVIEFFYAPNSKRLIQYAQNMYRDKKYNKYKTILVGVSKYPEEMRLISAFESFHLKHNMMEEAYSERIEP